MLLSRDMKQEYLNKKLFCLQMNGKEEIEGNSNFTAIVLSV